MSIEGEIEGQIDSLWGKKQTDDLGQKHKGKKRIRMVWRKTWWINTEVPVRYVYVCSTVRGNQQSFQSRNLTLRHWTMPFMSYKYYPEGISLCMKASNTRVTWIYSLNSDRRNTVDYQGDKEGYPKTHIINMWIFIFWKMRLNKNKLKIRCCAHVKVSWLSPPSIYPPHCLLLQ